MNQRYPLVTQSANGYCPAQVTKSNFNQILTQEPGAMGPTWDQVGISQATCPAWTAFTCTVTPGSGSITSQTSGMSYLQIGKLVHVNGSVQITNTGTAAGTMKFSLPVAAKRIFSILFRETGISGSFYAATAVATGATALTVTTSANANPTWANNFTIAVAFVYEAQ